MEICTAVYECHRYILPCFGGHDPRVPVPTVCMCMCIYYTHVYIHISHKLFRASGHTYVTPLILPRRAGLLRRFPEGGCDTGCASPFAPAHAPRRLVGFQMQSLCLSPQLFQPWG